MDTESQLQVSNSEQQNEGTSFSKTCFHGLNALAGIGILSMPYAVSQGGWLSFMLLIIFAMICWYTALLLERCMNQQPLIKSYPDIGEVAFGYKGRVVIASFIYVELFLVAVELLILEGDNLEKLFPNMSFTLFGLRIGSKSGFVLITALIILPSTWLRSLGALAYIALCGIMVSFILAGCVVWVGEFDGVGFHERGKLVNFGGLSTAMSLFAFSYCAHGLMPTLSNSMNDRKQFSKVLLVCFMASTIINGAVAVLGYMMFGDHLKSQITLNLPTNKISTKIAIYATVITPFTKYAMVITPIINAIEDKWHLCKRRPLSILIRTSIVISSVIVALFVPFFGYIMAFIGAFLSMAMSLLFPCICYLKMHKAARRFGLELIIIISIMSIGTFIGIQGTYSSLVQIVKNIKT
ncbi:amino acid transporter AVT1I [Medicago truncatula]|uniref:Transmembrane amino acid transporter family protein n=2 Tax=Medicago truncatula TaxID=3880 RepID=A0A072TS74_MEDTR|nr:amino acid transporter AVT1I [Medicago truncatula]KEH19718.1 transmembrane amino acid transporter family protein [Medicago truncatula]